MKKIQVYYSPTLDIMCIVEGKNIWKYVGEDAPVLIKNIFPNEQWYKARSHPRKTNQECFSYELIGEL